MKPSKSSVSRRTFLKTMGSALAYAPIVNMLRVRITDAAPAVAPLRLILVFEDFQATQPYSYPQSIVNGLASGIGAEAGAPFTLNFANSTLAPYIPYQSQMIVFRGLNKVDAQESATAGHMSGGTIFTGAKCNYGNGGSSLTTSGTSIDNYIASRLSRVSPSLFGPINAGWMSTAGDAVFSFNGAANSAGIPSTMNPLTAYNTFFSSYNATRTGSNAAATMARRGAIYSNTLSHLQQLRSRLASSEGAVLDAHVAAIQTLQAQATNTGPSCSPPLASSMTNDKGDGSGNPNYANMTSDMANWSSIITQAFACDLTRVATFQIGQPDDDGETPSIYSNITTQIGNNLSNAGFNSSNGGYHGMVTHETNAVATTNPTSPDLQIACYDLYIQQQIAGLMAKLQSAPDPYSPSQTLLDNTVILLTSMHANQEAWNNGGTIQGTDGHSYVDGKFILLGGCGGLFKGNQIIAGTPRIMPFSAGLAGQNTLVSATPSSSTGYAYYMGMPHNALLTTIVNAFEYNLGQFSSSYTPDILKWYGEPSFQTWNKSNWSALNLGQTKF